MISAKPIREIESKIRELERKREELMHQRALELSRIIEACDIEEMDPEVFAGALQYIRTAITLKDAKVDLWRSSGRKVMRTISQGKPVSSTQIEADIKEKPARTKARKSGEERVVDAAQTADTVSREAAVEPADAKISTPNQNVELTLIDDTSSDAHNTLSNNVAQEPHVEEEQERKVANGKNFLGLKNTSYLDDIYMEKILENWS